VTHASEDVLHVTNAGMQRLEGQERYVEGALRLLQFVEQRRPTGRRFGADADARWSDFKGDLRTVDRIELMIRDADAEWPGAFGARTVYALRGVPEDEPFGSSWPEVDPVTAEELWRRLRDAPAPTTTAASLAAIAAVWGLALRPHAVGEVSPTDRLLVAGPSAIAALIETFAAGAALDWADQVTVVATPAAHRQLASSATAILNGARAFTLLSAIEPPSRLPSSIRPVVSDDADARDRDAVRALASEAA